MPLLDQLAFVFAAVLAFEAIRNTAWIALVALAVLPQLVDQLRSPAVEPRHLNRILATTILATVVITVGLVAIKPTTWFTTPFPAAAARAAAAAAGPNGRVFATSDYADWLLWARPDLAGRVAFDARFELLSQAQVRRIAHFQARAGGWLATARGYRVFVLNRGSDQALAQALRRNLPARVVFNSPQVVVLRRRG